MLSMNSGDALGHQATERAAGLTAAGEAVGLWAVSSLQARKGLHHPPI
jgi:hypothetical protein